MHRFALVLVVACASHPPPICKNDAFELGGEVAGKSVSVSTTVTAYNFNNTFGVTAGALAVQFDMTGEVNLEWSTVAVVDEDEPVRGSVTLVDGSTYSVSAGDLIVRPADEGGGVSFELTKLAEKGAPAGSVTGCAAP